MIYTLLINLLGGNSMPFYQYNEIASDRISDGMIKELHKQIL